VQRRATLKEGDWQGERSPLDDLLGFTPQEDPPAPCQDFGSQDQKDSNVPAICAYNRHQVVDHSRKKSSSKEPVEAANRSVQHRKSKSGTRTAKNYASVNQTQLSLGPQLTHALVSPTNPLSRQGRNHIMLDQQCREVANASLKNFYPSHEKLRNDLTGMCSPTG